jgi:uncharacterized GH25 family protein
MCINLKLKLLRIILLILFCIAAADAHETFVRPISGWAEIGDKALLLAGSSHGTESEELLEGFASIRIISQTGVELNHTLDEKTTTNGYWELYDFSVDEPGLDIIDLYHTEGSWTHIITNPPVKDLWENKYFDEINWSELNTTGWADDWYVETSYPKYCYAKAFVACPSSDFSLASKPVGQTLEIVPLDNITTVGKGELRFQVLFNGLPFDNITVVAEKIGGDARMEARTDKEGEVGLNLSDAAVVSEWLLKVDTGADSRVVEQKVLPRGKSSSKLSLVGPVYRATLTLRSDYIKPV